MAPAMTPAGQRISIQRLLHTFFLPSKTAHARALRHLRLLLAFILLLVLLQSAAPVHAGSPRTDSTSAHWTPLFLCTNYLCMNSRQSLQVGVAFDFRRQWRAPLSKLQGDLLRLALVRVDVGVAPNVVLQLRGPAYQQMAISAAPATLPPGIPSSGTTNDVGDFSFATIVRLLQSRSGDSALGLQVGIRLPNSTQRKGLGLNATDVSVSMLLSRIQHKVILFGEIGLGILTAPAEVDEQNDVLRYGFGFAYPLADRLRVGGEFHGHLTTRDLIPIGTEARGVARLGLAWQFSSLFLEAALTHGVTANEGDWGGTIGLVWRGLKSPGGCSKR